MIALLLLLSGCPQEHEDPALHACEHLELEGTPVAATTDLAAAPAVTVAHDPWLVSLPDGEPGYVRLDPGDHEAVLLFADTADVLQALVVDGVEQPLSGAPNAHCPEELPEHHDLEIVAGELALKLGPAAIGEVWLQIVEGTHAHE